MFALMEGKTEEKLSPDVENCCLSWSGARTWILAGSVYRYHQVLE